MEFLCTSELGLLDFQEDLVDRLRGGEGKSHRLLTRFPSDPASASPSPIEVEGKINGMVGSLGGHRHCGDLAMSISPVVASGVAVGDLMISLRSMVLACGSKLIVIGAPAVQSRNCT